MELVSRAGETSQTRAPEATLGILQSLGRFVADPFKLPRRLEAKNLFLSHALNIALRRAPPLCCCTAVHCFEFLTNRGWDLPCPVFISSAILATQGRCRGEKTLF